MNGLILFLHYLRENIKMSSCQNATSHAFQNTTIFCGWLFLLKSVLSPDSLQIFISWHIDFIRIMLLINCFHNNHLHDTLDLIIMLFIFIVFMWTANSYWAGNQNAYIYHNYYVNLTPNWFSDTIKQKGSENYQRKVCFFQNNKILWLCSGRKKNI